jgi:hypothetical protein
MSNQKEIYFHVGLAKTATTFLQYRVFPYFKNVHYLQRTHYKHFKKSIENADADKIFISNEFDRQLEREMDNFSEHYPHARPIIVLRRHDKWIASQYRRSVKNGNTNDFEDYIDLDNDQGNWKQEELYFYPKIKYLEKKFDHKPLVLFFEELKEDSFAYFDRFADYMDADYNKKDINTNPKHKAYSDKQLKVIKEATKKGLKSEIDYSDIYLVRKVQRLIKMIPRYLVLYSALLMPDSWIRDNPLVPADHLKRVKEFYKKDWNKCKEYAKNN